VTAPARRPGVFDDLRELAASRQGASLVPAALLGVAVLDAIPTPTDIGYFWGEAALNYYGWDVAWYLTLFGATSAAGQTFAERVRVGGGVIAAGAIASMLYRYTHEAPSRPYADTSSAQKGAPRSASSARRTRSGGPDR
jgi:hypothetical protein